MKHCHCWTYKTIQLERANINQKFKFTQQASIKYSKSDFIVTLFQD